MDTLSIKFKCTICKTLPNDISNVFHCQDGHQVCDKCFKKSSVCKICDRPLMSCPLAWNYLDPHEVKYDFGYPSGGGKIVDVLSKDLDCVGCWQAPFKPIHKCSNGHLICGNCVNFDEITNCPKCDDNNLVFCELADRWLKSADASLLVPCTYNLCSKYVKAHEMEDHVKNKCEFRWICCSGRGYDYCGKGLFAKHIYKHLKTVHHIPVITSNTGEFTDTLVWQRFDPPTTFYEVKFDEETFLVNRAVENGTFSFWISIKGDDDVAKHYEFEITLQKLHYSKTKLPEVTRRLSVIPLHSSQVRSKNELIKLHYSEIIHIFQESNAVHPVTAFKSNYACSIKYKIIKVYNTIIY